ncbi:MAG TPA: hypothetical protein VFY65_20345 [Longimicrobium sp.]|nr:hypothetical protein [Longimicrobium sp.]
MAARTRRTTSRNAGSPPSSVRSTSVLTKKPISSSVSGRVRPAIGLPTTTSSVPAYLPSSTWKAASITMYSVAPSPRATACSRCTSAAGSSTASRAPRYVCTAGRGWSVGSSSSAGAPASCSFQYATWASSTAPCSWRRCQTA